MRFRLAKTDKGYFIPAEDSDMKKCSRIGAGEVVRCKSVDQRNLQFHRKFFAMINLAWDNMPEKYDNHFPTPEHLRKELIKRAGFYTSYTDLKGNTQYLPESISFESMGQEKFEEVYNRVLDVIIRWLIPDLDRDILEHEIMNFL